MFPSPVRSDNWRFENLVNFNTNSYLGIYIGSNKYLESLLILLRIRADGISTRPIISKWRDQVRSESTHFLSGTIPITYSGLTRVAYCIPAYSMRYCASTSSKVWICVKQACRHVPIAPRSEKDQLMNGNIDRCLKDHSKLGERVSKYL